MVIAIHAPDVGVVCLLEHQVVVEDRTTPGTGALCTREANVHAQHLSNLYTIYFIVITYKMQLYYHYFKSPMMHSPHKDTGTTQADCL